LRDRDNATRPPFVSTLPRPRRTLPRFAMRTDDSKNADDSRDVPVRTTRLRDRQSPFVDPPPATTATTNGGLWNRPDRPRTVGFIGWVTVAAGYVSFCVKGGTLPRYFIDMRWLNPNYVAPVLTRGQFATEVLMIVADMLLGLMAIAVGLAALRMRDWGRRGLIWYASIALLLGAIKATYQFTMFDTMIDQGIAASTQPIDRQMAENREFFYLVTATPMMAVWPLLVLWIATRPHVRRAYDRANGRSTPDDADGFVSRDA
jgi:heme/copper-type cytochrome/quinol oxidase subunit 3